MSRPKNDGSKAAEPNKMKLTKFHVQKLKPRATPFNIWDTKTPGLVLRIQPSGHKAFKFVYSFRGRPRWYDIGWVGLQHARNIVDEQLRPTFARGKDPVAERQAEYGTGTFGELADRYLEQKLKAGKRCKSYKHARHLVETYLFPKWKKLDAKSITIDQVEKLFDKIKAPVLANRVLAAASPIFNWGLTKRLVTVNPCRGIMRNETKPRERVLSESEIKTFWQAFSSAGLRGSALKMILLTGQRPGEIAKMRREHLIDGWWQMPGSPVPALGWNGTKSGASHRAWVSEAARAVIAELPDSPTGFVFSTPTGKAVRKLSAAMQAICKQIGAERITPHDLRRTFCTRMASLGYDRHAQNRVTNHKEGGIADVYDRYRYEKENKAIMEAVGSHILELANGRQAKWCP
jgi:integrase